MSELHAIEANDDTGKKNFGVYVIGIALCVILTLIPFSFVLYDKFAQSLTLSVIFISALLQFLVQVRCFLQFNSKTEEGRMDLMCFAFTILVLVVVVGGSMWIMWHLNYNMMH